jgi:hypothetical protein
MVDKFAIALATLFVAGCVTAALAAESQTKPRHRDRHAVAPPVEPAPPLPVYGGTLVLHPAHNIACDTRGRATRALPCDQPVWVYGNPCEIDEGLGYFRNCDEPPGVGKYDRWRSYARPY